MITTLRNLLLDLPSLRTHVHLNVEVRTTPETWDEVFDLVAEAAHHLDEEVMCSGSLDLPDRLTAQVEVWGYRMSRRQAEALQDRVQAALAGRIGATASLTRRRRRGGEDG